MNSNNQPPRRRTHNLQNSQPFQFKTDLDETQTTGRQASTGRPRNTNSERAGGQTRRPIPDGTRQRTGTTGSAYNRQRTGTTGSAYNRQRTGTAGSRQSSTYDRPRNTSRPSTNRTPRPTAKQPEAYTPKTTIGNIFYVYGVSLYLPLAFLFMEIVFHIYMKLEFKYVFIYGFFALSAGLVCSLLCSFFSEKVNKIISYVLTGIFSLLFSIEICCKAILSQYFQLLSNASTAANNHLSDYSDAIVQGIIGNLWGIILMFIPLIVLLILSRKRMSFVPKKLPFALITVVGALALHILALICLHIPFKSVVKASELYKTDTEIEEQVKQLGVITMLRLDVKHAIFGVDRSATLNTDDMDKLNHLQNNDGNTTTDETTESEVIIDTSPNVLGLDFEGLSANSSSDSVKWLNQYFSTVAPTNKNEYTGKFAGYNVIFITAEGLSGYAISEELTPTLYKLSHQGFVFNNFYTPLHYTSTSNGECQNLLSLYPKNGEAKTLPYVGEAGLSMPFTLANQLNNLGYTSIGYHFNSNMYGRTLSHPQIGYNWKDSSVLELEKNQYGNNIWPQSDYYMVTQSFDEYITQEPFNIYYMTISGHMPYTNNSNSMTVRNWASVENLPYSYDTQCYLAATLELEKGMTELVNRLEAAGVADRTLIVMAPDHIPYFDLPILEELAGQTFGASEDAQYLNESNMNFEVYKNSLIMWTPSMTETVEINKVCGQVDILPTVSNLLGLDYDSRLMEGTDILSESEGLVVFTSRSWKSDRGLYNSYSGTFTPAEGVTMTEEETATYVDAMKTAVSYKLQATILIMDTNYYAQILPGGVPVNESKIVQPRTNNSNTPVTDPAVTDPTADPNAAPVTDPASDPNATPTADPAVTTP